MGTHSSIHLNISVSVLGPDCIAESLWHWSNFRAGLLAPPDDAWCPWANSSENDNIDYRILTNIEEQNTINGASITAAVHPVACVLIKILSRLQLASGLKTAMTKPHSIYWHINYARNRFACRFILFPLNIYQTVRAESSHREICPVKTFAAIYTESHVQSSLTGQDDITHLDSRLSLQSAIIYNVINNRNCFKYSTRMVPAAGYALYTQLNNKDNKISCQFDR